MCEFSHLRHIRAQFVLTAALRLIPTTQKKKILTIGVIEGLNFTMWLPRKCRTSATRHGMAVRSASALNGLIGVTLPCHLILCHELGLNWA